MQDHKGNFSACRYIYRNNSVRLSVLAMVACVSPAFASAAEAPHEIYQVGEVLVSASYLEPEVGTVYRITPQDFERTNARSLDEALREIPSINVRNGADGTPRLDVRGLRTRQIKLLVNGIPFNSAEDGQFDPTLIPTFAIGRIQLQAGASSVLYGDGGVGGVLDIQTRGGFQGLKVGGKAEFGSDHYWNTNAYAGYGDGTNDFFAAAGVRARDAFPMSDDFASTISSTRQNFQDGDQRNNSDYRRVNLISSYMRKITEDLRIGIFLSRAEGDYGKPPSVLDCQGNSPTCVGSTGDPFAATTKYERTENQKGTTVQLGGDYNFNVKWSGRLWFFNNKLEQDTTSYDNANYSALVRKNSFFQSDRTLIRGMHAQLNGEIEATKTALGFIVDRRSEQFDADGISCDNASNSSNQTCVVSGGLTAPSAGGTKRFNYSPIAVSRDIRVTSYAGEITQPLPYEFSLVVGAGRHVLDKDGGNNESATSAQLALSKKLLESSTAYATVARKADAPTIRQLYDAKSGNDSLGFERANHYEVGLKNHWAKAEVDVALYQARVHDFIEKNETTYLYENRQKLLFRGIDLNGKWRPTDTLSLWAGLGLLHARDESSDRDSETLQYRPRHKLTMNAEYRFMSSWVLSGNYQRVGGQAYFNKNDAADYRNLDSYDLLSAQVRYLLPRDTGSVYIGADNLLDEDYETSYGFPQAGRFAYMGLQLNW